MESQFEQKCIVIAAKALIDHIESQVERECVEVQYWEHFKFTFLHICL